MKLEKPNKKKKLSLPQETQYADVLLSLYVRLRDKKCVTCSSILNLECSHYITKGAAKILRWDYRNTNTQCKKCHYSFHHNNPNPYTVYMARKYGSAIFFKFEQKRQQAKNINFRITRSDIKIIQQTLIEDICELCEKNYFVEIEQVKKLISKRSFRLQQAINYITE